MSAGEVIRVRTDAFGTGRPAPTSQAVRVPAGRDLLFTTGLVARDADGRIVGEDAGAQTRRVFANLHALLAEAGATPADVVSATIYLRDMSDLGALRDVRAEHWPQLPPVLTTVEVTALALPDALVEMSCIVALPADA